MKTLQGKRNLTYLEVLRLIAIFAVLFNHTGNSGFTLFAVTEESGFLYNLFLFMSIACKVAVPTFFMISGALLLGKEESYGTWFRKRVLRMLIILILMSFAYQAYDCVRNDAVFEWSSFLSRLYGDNLSVGLWYMYAYLGIMLMLPLLRKMVQHMKTHDFIYFGAMYLLFVGALPIMQYLLWQDELVINVNIRGLIFTSLNLMAFIMGYFFIKVLPDKYYKWRYALIGIILSFAAIGMECYVTVFQQGIIGEYTENYYNSLIIIPVCTLFYCAKLISMHTTMPNGLRTVVTFAGGTVFGTYLCERMLRQELMPVFDYLNERMGTMPACLLYILTCCLAGFICVFVLKLLWGLAKAGVLWAWHKAVPAIKKE